jgi:ribonuclease P protein subunit POP4
MDTIGPKILKADLHGAYVMVCSSQTPSVVGKCGIVLLERRHSIMIVSKDSRLIKIPKHETIFQFQVCGLVIKLHGSQLCMKSSERSVHKFKQKH